MLNLILENYFKKPAMYQKKTQLILQIIDMFSHL